MPNRSDLPTRICAVCGREMAWRKAWARSFDQVRYCSDACRKVRLTERDIALQCEVIAVLLSSRRGAIVDPEQVVPGEREAVRRAVRRLAARGQVEVVESGRVVDPSRARGSLGARLPV